MLKYTFKHATLNELIRYGRNSLVFNSDLVPIPAYLIDIGDCIYTASGQILARRIH